MSSRPRSASRSSRAPSRQAREQKLVAQARAVSLPSQVDVAVMGGGAAGLAAAITAAEAGARVVVVERSLECGRSILATGGGRCNLANTRLSAKRYRHPSFVDAVCGEHFLGDVLGFFSASGLAVAEEEGGRLYPVTREASSVREVLVAEALSRDARGVLRARGAGGASTQGWRNARVRTRGHGCHPKYQGFCAGTDSCVRGRRERASWGTRNRDCHGRRQRVPSWMPGTPRCSAEASPLPARVRGTRLPRTRRASHTGLRRARSRRRSDCEGGRGAAL